MEIPDITVPIGHNIENNELISWGTEPIYSHLLVNGVDNVQKTFLIQNVMQYVDESQNPKKILYYSANTDAQKNFIVSRTLPYENIRYYDNKDEVLFLREASRLFESRFKYFQANTNTYNEKALAPIFLVIDDYNSLSKEGRQHVSNLVRFGRVARINVIASYSPFKPFMPEETRMNFGFMVHCFENKPVIAIEHYAEAFIAVPKIHQPDTRFTKTA